MSLISIGRFGKGSSIYIQRTIAFGAARKIEDLPIPFGVGLCTMDRKALMVTKGNLVDAIAASCLYLTCFVQCRFKGSCIEMVVCRQNRIENLERDSSGS